MKNSLLPILQKTERQSGKWRCFHPLFRDCRRRSRSPRHLKWLRLHSHKHADREIMICLAGNTFYGIGNEVINCRPGQIIFFESGQEHQTGYPPFSPDCIHLWIRFISHHASAWVSGMSKGQPKRWKAPNYFKSYPEIGVWPERNWPAKAYPGLPPDLLRRRLLNMVSILLADIIQSMGGRAESEQHSITLRQKIVAIQKHIWETGGKDATLNDLSEIAGYSKYHFLRLFKSITGQSVHEFVNTARVNKYHELLKCGVFKKQIADRLGFSCPAAFSRWLRQNAR